MSKHRVHEKSEDAMEQNADNPVDTSEVAVLSIPAELAQKWGVPLVCLESIAYATAHTATNWPGLQMMNSANETAKRTAFDTMGQTLARVVPFSTATAAYIAGGAFEDWANVISTGITPGAGPSKKFTELMITFKTKE